MSIFAYLVTWDTIVSQPELAKNQISLIDSAITENPHQDYEIKDEFNPVNSFRLNQMNIVQLSYNFSQLNSVNPASNLFLFPLKQTLNDVKPDDRQQAKSHNK